jgi:molybdopterin converting factor small subunit
MVTLELYGVLRMRARQAHLKIQARSVREALAAAEHACPPLAGILLDESGRPRIDYRVAVNGGAVLVDPDAELVAGDSLVLLHAHAGG